MTDRRTDAPDHTAAVRSRRRSSAVAVATTLTVAVLSTPGLAAAEVEPAEDRLGGHQARATATPLSLLLFEERIRITTSPEGEADLAYTDVSSSTGPAGRAVASALWPGPLIGDALPLLTSGAGLPALAYPVSAKSTYPAGGTTDSDLGPAARQRASTSEDVMLAQVGIDQRPDAAGDGPDGPADGRRGSGSAAALSTGVPLGGSDSGEPAAADEPDPASALYTVDSVTSRSKVTHSDTEIVTEALSRVAGVELLAGLVHVDSVVTRVTTASNGAKARSVGTTEVVGLEVQGTPVVVGGRGVRVAGQRHGSPDSRDLRTRLTDLGIGLGVVEVERRVKGATGSAIGSGLVVDVDSSALRSQLDTAALEGALGNLPPEVGTNLQLALSLAPRLVYRLGYGSSTTAGSPMAELPDLPTVEPPGDEADEDSDRGAGGDTAGGGGSIPPMSGGNSSDDVAGALPAPSGGFDPAAGESPEGAVQLAGGAPGLPPLYGGPGALLLLGLLLASAAGVLFHRFGAAALGAGRPCVHGNELGIPDLRKV